ncbi:two-component system histidine kinase PnpS [Salsuginibacillus kocurii]|uniref:two-component system histidine kinase PnpS n=1 Tax=Salsuginibacillus kocurii TaxID=427078 RepID=UPI000366B7F8|nr:ATP-binding protein [Salsuginibacillus kocurii]
MMKFRTRLVSGMVIVIFFVLSALGFLIAQLVEDVYVDQLSERLSKEAELAALTFEDHGMEDEGLEVLTEQVGERLDLRVTLLTEDGYIIEDTEEARVGLEENGSPPENLEALENGEGGYVRESQASGEELMFSVQPIGSTEEPQGYLRLGMPTAEFNYVNQNIWMFIGITFTVAFILIVVLTYRITNQLTKPIGQVTKVAHELAKGNFKARTYEQSADEIGELTQSVNALAYNLDQITASYQSQQERLKTLIENMGSGLFFIDHRGDITLINRACHEIFEADVSAWLDETYYEVIKDQDVVQAIQQIFITEESYHGQISVRGSIEMRHYDLHGAPIMSADSKLRGVVIVLHDISELKRLEQIRKDFVANVSHELKTPVTSLKGFAETLLDGAMETPELREQFLDIIWKESDRLQDLITDLLELSKIEQEYFQLNWGWVEAETVAVEVAELLKPKAQTKQIELDMTISGDTWFESDSARLKQILINLINNSIAYTPEEGKVNVAVNGKAEEIEIIVVDTGEGISEEEIPRIFERFYRVDKARSRNSGGTGLGLAIVKHLTDAHGGKIEVESTISYGTRFTLTFNRQRFL